MYVHAASIDAPPSSHPNATLIQYDVRGYYCYARYMGFDIITLVAIAANVLGGAMAVPQARKLIRDRRTEGVSPVWAAMSMTLNVWWGVYALGVRDLAILPVSIVSVMAYLTISVALVSLHPLARRRRAAHMLVAVVAASSIPLTALLAGGWVLAGMALGAMYGIQLTPAVVQVYRSADVSGVSAATWVIALVEAALWGIYGLHQGDLGLIALAATGSTMSSLVLVRLFVRRPRRYRSPGYRMAPAY